MALSKKIAKVSETMMFSNATMPVVPFCTKCHPLLAAQTGCKSGSKASNGERRSIMTMARHFEENLALSRVADTSHLCTFLKREVLMLLAPHIKMAEVADHGAEGEVSS